MSINQRQFSILTEMGIPLWRRSALVHNSNADLTNRPTNKIPVNNKTNVNLPLNYTELTTQQIFQDILLSINLSLADINEQNTYLAIGLLHWHFVNTNTITLSSNTLSTPALTDISNSSQFKRQLWQVLQDHK